MTVLKVAFEQAGYNDARRVMMKAVIEDLWRVWNGKEPLIR